MKKIFIVYLLLLCSISLLAQKKYDFAKYFKNLPFKMEALTIPKFPNKTFNIKHYGAVGDGMTLNTESFTKAIEACSKAGGGKVIVPAGMWLTGPIHFKSNVNLHLEIGAHIQFSKNYDDYPLIESNWEGLDQYRCTSPINGKNLTNIAITGDGIIDGSGEVWRYVKKSKLTSNQWNKLVAAGGVVNAKGDNWYPTKESLEYLEFADKLKKEGRKITRAEAENYKTFFRPVLLSFIECKNVWLDGVTFQNSPAWNLHPLLCENVLVTNVNVRNPWYSQNGDGIDIDASKNVFIYNSKFDVGDDAICMKSGRDEEGRKRGRATENVVIQDCIVYFAHGGFTIGSEMSGGVRNIKVDNCNFIGTSIGLRFKSTRGRGGVVENIWVSNIFMKDIITDALSFNMYYGGFSPADDKPADEKVKEAKTESVSESTPIFRNIYMKNIFCDGAKDAIVIQGLPEMSIKNIKIENSVMKAERGISIYDADGIEISSTKIAAQSPVVKIHQSKNVLFDNFEPEAAGHWFKIDGAQSSSIIFKGKNASELKAKTQLGAGVSQDAVIIK
ncbi:MAG: exo-poly-alpha-D-galacturonosidase [Ignavibacteria bacterium]|nr:MAG: exo-poly-alpha-D-galacturonosidase [Ignavibacteria bacterium]KAF0161908.1 MAG: exo-poly-alpha-D-galacturonosidase [Ignavibacteria bacterium]